MLTDEQVAEIQRRRAAWLETPLGSPASARARDRYTDYLLIVLPLLLSAHADAVRYKKALETIAGYDKHSKTDGICPYGCDTPSIARAALRPAEQGGA